MGKNPCFLFYPADWDRDMGYHPLEIGGAWMLILCSLFWEGGSASKTLQEWSKIIRENQKKTEKILDYLSQKSICDLLNQNEMITITARRMVRDIKIREIRKLAGSKGGNPLLTSSKKDIDLLNQNVKQNASKSQPPSVSVSVSVSNHKQKAPKKTVFVRPDWIKKETWEAYREMRYHKRAPLTDRASALIIKELEKLKSEGHNPEDVLNESIMKAWTGVFPLRGGDRNGREFRTNRTDPQDKILQSREDIEVAAITAKWEADKKAARDKTRRTAGNDDAPDFASGQIAR